MISTTQTTTHVVLVDDHLLFRKGMVELVNGFAGYQVVGEASNGREFVQQLSPQNLPDILLLDISMPIMDGFETARWMEQRYPEVKILALSMHNDEETILKMLKAGVNGYVLKNADPEELQAALQAIDQEGTYYSSHVTQVLYNNLVRKKEVQVELNEREVEFLKLACTELPYKSFSPLLQVHPRVVEGIREGLFKKLNVTSRVGLVIYAIKHGIYTIE
ncbi:DNA-binding response regulator, NarL/FixJ family, contains REC and HTH domains [Catalinimonas alkaloidigena]|uniref:DNA-binding response regulator, NarL/FixJ family, contains REC and HTH domains n=1 Tax=Catalinimonas alkaloidigena TaxID=1075417 RepID=A0A1G9GI44_9BACT|nr:response regulator transcription factor [Catalinimonas alkaloidigena]SDL00351.1 DNA-binding response regulator, NarL/FixJ family, contains REC and HTH domains [Catalinimonas alkaloidigena]